MVVRDGVVYLEFGRLFLFLDDGWFSGLVGGFFVVCSGRYLIVFVLFLDGGYRVFFRFRWD